jgi:hypothetical protein
MLLFGCGIIVKSRPATCVGDWTRFVFKSLEGEVTGVDSARLDKP